MSNVSDLFDKKYKYVNSEYVLMKVTKYRLLSKDRVFMGLYISEYISCSGREYTDSFCGCGERCCFFWRYGLYVGIEVISKSGRSVTRCLDLSSLSLLSEICLSRWCYNSVSCWWLRVAAVRFFAGAGIEIVLSRRSFRNGCSVMRVSVRWYVFFYDFCGIVFNDNSI